MVRSLVKIFRSPGEARCCGQEYPRSDSWLCDLCVLLRLNVLTTRDCGKSRNDYTAAMLPPMVERELRVGLLRRKARDQWVRAAWLAGGISLFFLLFMAVGSSSSSGRALFRFL